VRRFVLTGGHGVGKTSIIAALEMLGENVVHEAASTVRAADRARGLAFPEDETNFEMRVLGLHLRREEEVRPEASRFFLDRGAPDHLAYAQVGHWSLGTAETSRCLGARYDAAFMIEPPPGGVPTLNRGEVEFCRRLTGALERVYQEMAIPLVRVPHGPLDARCRSVLAGAEAVGI